MTRDYVVVSDYPPVSSPVGLRARALIVLDPPAGVDLPARRGRAPVLAARPYQVRFVRDSGVFLVAAGRGASDLTLSRVVAASVEPVVVVASYGRVKSLTRDAVRHVSETRAAVVVDRDEVRRHDSVTVSVVAGPVGPVVTVTQRLPAGPDDAGPGLPHRASTAGPPTDGPAEGDDASDTIVGPARGGHRGR